MTPSSEQGAHDLAMVVMALARPGWLYADEIRGRLRHFGIVLSSQQVVGALTRMVKEDAPRFERERVAWGGREWRYRATRYAQTDLENKLPNLRCRERAS